MTVYSSVGQRYEPEHIGSALSYRKAMDGQILGAPHWVVKACSTRTAPAT